MSVASRLQVVFDKAKAEDRGVLAGCMPAGFPTVERGVRMTQLIDELAPDEHDPD